MKKKGLSKKTNVIVVDCGFCHLCTFQCLGDDITIHFSSKVVHGRLGSSEVIKRVENKYLESLQWSVSLTRFKEREQLTHCR